MFIQFVELGQVTPPVGINLFVIHSISGGRFSDVLYGTVPFLALMLLAIIVVTIFPQIVLWLPHTMY